MAAGQARRLLAIEFPAATERPKEYFWMVRFAKGDTDFGGFVATGGRLGVVCTPFTGK